jgi:hypothetical protein
MSDVHIYQLNYSFEFLGGLGKVIWYHIYVIRVLTNVVRG